MLDKNFSAVILAAGESSRCWPINKGHKSRMVILGKSLIYWTIKGLISKGIKDIVLIVGPDSFLKEDLASAVQDLGLNLSYAIQEKPLGTGNAIFRAKDFIKQPFFIFWPYKINAGDIVEKILEKYKVEKAQTILVGAKTAAPWDHGIFKLKEEKIIEIVEKPKSGEEPSDIKVAGTCFFQPDFFDYYQSLPQHHEKDFIDVLNIYIKNKKTEFVFWEKDSLKLKYPWDFLKILRIMFGTEKFKHFISSSARIGKNVTIKGKVYISDNVIIGDNTVISGSCFIDKNCKIGANNVLRGPISLAEEVATGAFMEIKNSIIGKGTHFHSGYLGDSIIGQNCRFGAGFITANRRFDQANIKSIVRGKKIDTGLNYFGTAIGDNAFFGVQSGTMPGVLVGSNCSIGPGTLVFENIEDNTIFYTKYKIKIKKSKNHSFKNPSIFSLD